MFYNLWRSQGHHIANDLHSLTFSRPPHCKCRIRSQGHHIANYLHSLTFPRPPHCKCFAFSDVLKAIRLQMLCNLRRSHGDLHLQWKWTLGTSFYTLCDLTNVVFCNWPCERQIALLMQTTLWTSNCLQKLICKKFAFTIMMATRNRSFLENPNRIK